MENETQNNTQEEVQNTQANTTIEDRVSNIEQYVATITETDLFLVAFIVVLVVCYVLYKSIDNFISF